PRIRHEICGVLVLLGVLTSVVHFYNSSFRNVMFRLTKETISRPTIGCQVRDRAALRSKCYGDDKLYSHR
ncbi:unnamed protein product, partial [Brassica rapa]